MVIFSLHLTWFDLTLSTGVAVSRVNKFLSFECLFFFLLLLLFRLLLLLLLWHHYHHHIITDIVRHQRFDQHFAINYSITMLDVAIQQLLKCPWIEHPIQCSHFILEIQELFSLPEYTWHRDRKRRVEKSAEKYDMLLYVMVFSMSLQ